MNILANQESDWGKKYLGHKAESKDIALFLSESILEDSEIIESAQTCAIFRKKYRDRGEKVTSPLNPIEEGKKVTSWKPYFLIDCNNDPDKIIDERDYILHYAGSNGKPISVEDKTDFIHVFYMPEFGDDYRISVFETMDKTLHLGYFGVNLNTGRQLVESFNINQQTDNKEIKEKKIYKAKKFR